MRSHNRSASSKNRLLLGKGERFYGLVKTFAGLDLSPFTQVVFQGVHRQREPFRITFCLLPFTFYLLPFTFCLLPFAFYLLPFTFCLLPFTLATSIGKLNANAQNQRVEWTANFVNTQAAE